MDERASEIAERYKFEGSELLCHVSFLSRTTSVTDAEVADADAGLRRHGLAPLMGRTPREGQPRPYSATEATQLLPALKEATSAAYSAFAAQHRRITELVTARRNEKGEFTDCTERAIRFALQLFATNTPTPDELGRVRERVTDYVEGPGADPSGKPVSVDLVMSYAEHRLAYRESERIQEVFGKLLDLRQRAMTRQPNQQTGIYRQAFILLMTLFDATVFDLARLALRNNLFGLVSAFGKRDKVSYEQMAKHHDFESLRDWVIEELLRRRYLKDVLFEFRNLGVDLPDQSQEGFPRVIELVLRRNIHLHNRGIVDERYMEWGENGRPKWNLDNLSLGNTAPIDDNYWYRAYNLCGCYVDTLAAWVDDGAVPNT